MKPHKKTEVAKPKAKASTPLTYTQIAAQEFEPIPEFVGFNPDAKKVHLRNLEAISTWSGLAIGLLGKTKDELIEGAKAIHAADGHEGNQILVKAFDQTTDRLKQLLEFIDAAKWRAVVAMANIYSEDGSIRSGKGKAQEARS